MKTQELFDRLDNLSFSPVIEEKEFPSHNYPQYHLHSQSITDQSTSDNSNLTEIDYSSDQYYDFDSYTDSQSSDEATDDTMNTSIKDILPVKKEIDTRLISSKMEYNLNLSKPLPNVKIAEGKEDFETSINILNSGVQHSRNLLDCVEDMIEQENQRIINELNLFIDFVDKSVPNNTFIINFDRCKK